MSFKIFICVHLIFQKMCYVSISLTMLTRKKPCSNSSHIMNKK